MGYRDALATRQRGIEGRELQKSAAKKGLWGSVGRTLGGLAATALTGGAAAPWAAALMAGGGSLIGGAAGSGLSGGKLKGGTFYRDEAESLQKELGAFGSRNITEALKGGATAGIGQKLQLMKGAKAAKAADPTMSKEAVKALERGKGFDFAGSTVGRGLQKAKTSKLAKGYADKGWIDPDLQGSVAEGGAPIVAMDRRYSGPGKFDFMDVGEGAADFGPIENIDQVSLSGSPYERVDFYGPSNKKPISSTLDWRDADVNQIRKHGGFGGDVERHFGQDSGQSVARELGDKFYSENVFGVGDKAGEVIPISEATPRPLKYGDQKVSAWDKFKDFIDVSDVKEERAIESQLSQYRNNMQANVPKESWQRKLGLYTGYGSEGYRPTTWAGETELQKGFDQYKTFKDTEVGGIPEWRLR